MKFSPTGGKSKLIFPIFFGAVLLAVSTSQKFDGENGDFDNAFFVSEIFKKYGNNNFITYEGFEHLLENLGLGRLKFETNHDVSIHKINGTFMEFHDKLSLHKHDHDSLETDIPRERKKRNPTGNDSTEKFDKRKCLTPRDILVTFGLEPRHDVAISPSKYLQICPAMIYELDQKLCQKDESTESASGTEGNHLVWIYASVSVFVMGISGIFCILLVPVIKKNYKSSLVQFLVSLAVGTLCGDSLIHLLPQVYSKGRRKSGIDLTPITKGTTTLTAIFLFFAIENLLKQIKFQKRKRFKGRVKECHVNMLPGSEVEKTMPEQNQESDEIKSLAWMAILGDVLHNVTDGLSIGAAFELSLSAGFASSIAIFCHELPHELGDYAILVASGMSAKKALFYNFVSTAFSFLGMAAGILLGEFHDSSSWINAFTAGSFLYIALSDLVPEMKAMSSNSHLKNFLIQLFGVGCGGILMFIIALYEDKIEDILS